MIYLSQLRLDPRSRQVQADVRDLYEMHRTLSHAFGDGPDEWQAARCLFRVEDAPLLHVLVQSRTRPDWGRLTVRNDYLAAPPEIKEYAPQFTPGQHLTFRLRANPTAARDGVRRGLYQEEEQLAWLTRKAAASGFRVCHLVTRLADPLCCRTAGGHRARFSAVQFDGTLQVLDPAVLQTALENGIGAGKGVGFGLLSLARPR